jgi:ATP-dependent RNA helicase DDX3X
MLENVKLCQYNAPTPIQSYCIPSILTGNDVVAIAQTGKFAFTPLLNITHIS